jgi:hypothetical protein
MGHVVDALVVLIIIGLLRRRYVRFCWSFLVYLSAVWAFDRLGDLMSDRSDYYTIYSAKETMLDVLKFVVALEIWQKSFCSFPRARLRVGILLALVLLATAIGTLTVSMDVDPYDALLSLISPRQKAGALGLFAVVVSGAWWYRIPLHPLHRAILLGFAGYLVLATLLASLLGLLGQEARWVLGRIDVAGYFAVSIWWAWAAWRTSHLPNPILTRLQPWARSW